MFKLKIARKYREQGFGLVEVLVAMLLTTFFVSVTMQAVVIATLMRVKAQENSASTNRIQEEIEQIKHEANTLSARDIFPVTTLTSIANEGSNTVIVKVKDGNLNDAFTPDDITPDTGKNGKPLALKLKIGRKIYTVASASLPDPQGKITVNLTSPLEQTYAVDEPVTSYKMCSADDKDKGIAQKFTSIASTREGFQIKYKDSFDYVLKREVEISDSRPSVLQLTYKVSPDTTASGGGSVEGEEGVEANNQSDIINQFYLEVIPSAALQCP